MTAKIPWQEQYQAEIFQAKKARIIGNEGMARVCARRAVGVLLGEYLSQQGIPTPGPSAYDRIRVFQGYAPLDPQIREIIDHFLLHVQADRTLPGNYDLIAEAEWLVSKLFD